MSEPDNSDDKRARPFDGFDDVAEGIIEPHTHAVVDSGYKPGTGRRLGALAVILALGLGGAFFFVSSMKANDEALLSQETEAKSKEPPAVEVVTIGPLPATQPLRLPGEARGWYSSTIFARVSGYVMAWLADIGDRVKKNQVLAVIDTPELDAQLDAAKAQLNASEAEMKVREVDAEFAKTTFERWQGSGKGVVSEQEREDKRAGFAIAAAKLKAAEAKVKLDKSNVDRLTYMTQFKQVIAPYDGVITERRIDLGDLVTAGSASNMAPLFAIAQYDRIRVFTNVPQSASSDIGVNTSAAIFVAEQPGQVFEGKVSRTSESINTEARTLRVEVDLPNANLKLLPGMYLQVEFHLKPKRGVQIPASALLFRSGGLQVAVIRPDNTVKFMDVQIGRDNGNTIEIVSGLSERERVALNINNQIADGGKVTVKE